MNTFKISRILFGLLVLAHTNAFPMFSFGKAKSSSGISSAVQAASSLIAKYPVTMLGFSAAALGEGYMLSQGKTVHKQLKAVQETVQNPWQYKGRILSAVETGVGLGALGFVLNSDRATSFLKRCVPLMEKYGPAVLLTSLGVTALGVSIQTLKNCLTRTSSQNACEEKERWLISLLANLRWKETVYTNNSTTEYIIVETLSNKLCAQAETKGLGDLIQNYLSLIVENEVLAAWISWDQGLRDKNMKWFDDRFGRRHVSNDYYRLEKYERYYTIPDEELNRLQQAWLERKANNLRAIEQLIKITNPFKNW